MAKCPKCGGRMNLYPKTISTTTTQGEINIENVIVEECDLCAYYEIPKESAEYIENIKRRHSLKHIENKGKVPLMINRFRNVRESLKLSQTDAGKNLGCKEQYIGHIERGFVTPTIFNALVYADALSVDIKDLYRLVYVDRELIVKLRSMYLDHKKHKLFTLRYVKEIFDEYFNVKEAYEKEVRDKVHRKELLVLKSKISKELSKALHGHNNQNEKAVLKPSRIDDDLYQILGKDFDMLFPDGDANTKHVEKLLDEVEKTP